MNIDINDKDNKVVNKVKGNVTSQCQSISWELLPQYFVSFTLKDVLDLKNTIEAVGCGEIALELMNNTDEIVTIKVTIEPDKAFDKKHCL